MAGSSMTFVYHDLGNVKKIVADWTSDDSAGTASATTKILSGVARMLITDPGATAPTADYDLVINNDEGIDVLGGVGVDRHTSTTEVAYPVGGTYFQPVFCGKLTFSISAAGNSKTGQAIFFYSEA